MTKTAQTPEIPQEEQDLRRENWRQANASVRIESGEISPAFLALQEKHITGQISEDEVHNALDEMDRQDQR